MKREKASKFLYEVFNAAGGVGSLADKVGVKYITLYYIASEKYGRGFADSEYRKPDLVIKILHEVRKNQKNLKNPKKYTVKQLLNASLALKQEK